MCVYSSLLRTLCLLHLAVSNTSSALSSIVPSSEWIRLHISRQSGRFPLRPQQPVGSLQPIRRSPFSNPKSDRTAARATTPVPRTAHPPPASTAGASSYCCCRSRSFCPTSYARQRVELESRQDTWSKRSSFDWIGQYSLTESLLPSHISCSRGVIPCGPFLSASRLLPCVCATSATDSTSSFRLVIACTEPSRILGRSTANSLACSRSSEQCRYG